jgi:hypothetical protein
MSKKKKYSLACRDCKAPFETGDPQARICQACVRKEGSRQVPKGPKPIDEMLR